jgi:hypothetical protein
MRVERQNLKAHRDAVLMASDPDPGSILFLLKQ